MKGERDAGVGRNEVRGENETGRECVDVQVAGSAHHEVNDVDSSDCRWPVHCFIKYSVC